LETNSQSLHQTQGDSGWAYAYVDSAGCHDGELWDCCVIAFGAAVPSLVGAVVYADIDDLAEIVRELELVPLADLVGSDDLPLPEPIDW
jgi:hypothetical protein